MGGAAFASDGLYTPRIPTAIYEKVLEDIESRLAPLFEVVTHAIDAPEKSDHGDLDILAAPLAGKQPQPEEIAKLLDAEKYQNASVANPVIYLALPWPTLNSTETQTTTGSPDDEKLTSEEAQKFIQVDLRICRSMPDLYWQLFAHGHGDLVNILASIIRCKGLTLSSQALWLRIPDLDTKNKRITRIELSKIPEQVMTFLGLKPDRFWHPFATRDEMMTYIATCRFYDPARLHEHEIKRKELIEGPLNSRDKSALENRPLFRYWSETFLPAHKNDSPCSAAHITRSEIEEEAFKFFGGDTRQRYNTVKHEVGTMLAREKLWSGIKTAIAENNLEMTETDLHDTLRAVRREIVASGDPDSTASHLSDVQKAYLMCDWPTVHHWAVTNHAAALARWREMVARSRMPPVVHEKKANKYSTSDLETYTPAEDRVIVQMKNENASWTQILGVLGKSSKSQLQAHWKNVLQEKET